MNRKPLFVALSILAAPIFIAAPAEAAMTGGTMILAENQDVIISFITSVNVADFDILLTDLRDTNDDGDFADAGETVNEVSLNNVLNCAANAHLSCTLAAAQDSINVIVWRNASTVHIVGNYTLTVTQENAVEAIVERITWAIRLTSAGLLLQDLTDAKESIRDQARIAENNQTTRLNSHDNNASYFDTVNGFDDQDTFIMIGAAKSTTTPATAKWAFQLNRRLDLNLDGDFSDAGESTQLLGVDVTANECNTAGLGAHFSCTINFATQRGEFVWRNTSSFHATGNYSILFQWEDANTIALRQVFIAINLLPATAQRFEVTQQFHNSDFNVTQHVQNNVTTSLGATEGNLTQNITVRLQNTQNNLTNSLTDTRHNITKAIHSAEANITGNVSLLIHTDHQTIVTADIEDTTWAFNDGPQYGSVAFLSPDSVRLKMLKLRDLNTDGDWLEADESSVLFDITTAAVPTECSTLGATISAILTCSIAGFAGTTSRTSLFTFRNSSAQHLTGNYSFSMEWLRSGSTVNAHTAEIQLVPPRAPGDVSETNIITNPPNATNDLLVRLALLLLVLVVVCFMAVSRGWVLPTLGMFLAMLLVVYKTTEPTIFGNNYMDTSLAILPIIPFFVGGYNAVLSFFRRKPPPTNQEADIPR